MFEEWGNVHKGERFEKARTSRNHHWAIIRGNTPRDLIHREDKNKRGERKTD